jgi:hypothetical protein
MALKSPSRVANDTILVVYGKITVKNAPKTARARMHRGLSLVETHRLGLDVLFLIRGLILLSARGLLGPLTRFVRHLIGLAGLVALLRRIRLILLCHNSSPDCRRSWCSAASADRHLDLQDNSRVALKIAQTQHRETAATSAIPHKTKHEAAPFAPKLKRK